MKVRQGFSIRTAGLPGALAVCVSLFAQAAFAQQSDYDVTGQVFSSCTLGQSAPFVLSTSIPANGKIDPQLSNTSWTTGGWFCNSPSRITLSARALRRSSPYSSLNPAQSQTINFTARASGWTSAEATVTTNETTPVGTGALFTGAPRFQNVPKIGTITVRVGNFIVAGTSGNSNNPAKPVQGAYSATITVTIAPSS